jgi:predicted TPR repeat methyltransferase
MLERARSLALYDELSQAELTAYLHAAPGSADVIVSGDAFCYFGSLAAVFQAAREALRPGGRLIFTLEADDDRHDFRLGASGRYSHGERYAREAAAAARLSVGVLRREAPRDEAGRPVAGFLVVLRRA